MTSNDPKVSARTIRIAIVGVGNCAKSLVEGISFYGHHTDDYVGLRNPLIGPYRVGDIKVVAAFDVDGRKVGRPLGEAIQATPNCTVQISEQIESTIVVLRGPTSDSITEELRRYYIAESDEPPVDITAELINSRVDIVINYLPTGSNEAARLYAAASLRAGCSFINCMPAPLMRDEKQRKQFLDAGLILLGDDIKSQVGATIVNRALLELLTGRGAKVKTSSQLNAGGNADHFNLQFRGADKKVTKSSALSSMLPHAGFEPTVEMIYNDKLFDHKEATLSISAEIFGHSRVSLRVHLEDEDSPNSAGTVVDAIRVARVLKEAGLQNSAIDVCPALMKAPPNQLSEEAAERCFQEAIRRASL